MSDIQDEGMETWRGHVVVKGEASKLDADMVQRGEAFISWSGQRIKPSRVTNVEQDIDVGIHEKESWGQAFVNGRAVGCPPGVIAQQTIPDGPSKPVKTRWLRWPRNRHGREIVGLAFDSVIDFLKWRWVPFVQRSGSVLCFRWLCFRAWFSFVFLDEHDR